MGVNFTGLENASVEEIPIISLMSGDFKHGDEVQIPKPNGVAGYNRAGWNTKVNKWCGYFRDTLTDQEVNFTIEPGHGFWFKSASSATTEAPRTLQIAGKVQSGDDITITLGQQYTIVSPISPEAIAINGDKLEWMNLSHGDQIQIPKDNADGYDIAGWNADSNKWCGIFRGEVTTKEVTLSISAGKSVWVVATKPTASVKFVAPLNN